MIEIVRNILFFVIALSILVAVHEWGHYIVAKWCKVKVLRFSIGFGKPLYKRVTSSGMEFVIAGIPLGGYVRLLDDRVDDVPPELENATLNSKSVAQRFAVYFAGPFVNFVFAVFALAIIGMIGQQAPRPVIGEILENGYAQQSDLASGDLILAVGEHETYNWRDVIIELSTFSGEQSIPLKVRTDGGGTASKSLPINGWKINPDQEDIFAALGFRPYSPPLTTQLGLVEEGSPAERGGLQKDDIIEKLDGTSVDSWSQIVDFIAPRPNQSVDILIKRGEERLNLNVKFGAVAIDEQLHSTNAQLAQASERGYLGVSPYREAWPEEYVITEKYGLFAAIANGTQETWRLMGVTLKMLGKLLTGEVPINNLSGPISIAEGAGVSASVGIVAFLSFLALISVNLGIINLLPLPILDGGHLLYLTIEWITGKPVSEAIQEVGFKIGGVILFAVMATAIANDILRNT
uniref:RIP metalloprotease RseP n=1 Tax=Ningiella ruwaisensis TaxID=2364274 RepID=UPI00109FF730|nr:RIP metalloprotease RseP [Ningiella ruwaisensis]